MLDAFGIFARFRRQKQGGSTDPFLPDGGQVLNPGSNVLQAARHVEFEVVPRTQAAVVAEVPNGLCRGRFDNPEHLVARVQVQDDFGLEFVFLHHLRDVVPEFVADISEFLVC